MKCKETKLSYILLGGWQLTFFRFDNVRTSILIKSISLVCIYYYYHYYESGLNNIRKYETREMDGETERKRSFGKYIGRNNNNIFMQNVICPMR